MSDLRDREINAITRMLTLAKSPFTTDFNDQWKVLIYDADGRDIISPLLHIGALRQKGVTLHLMVIEVETINDGILNIDIIC